MKVLTLKPVDHSVTVGDTCGEKAPNLTEDTLFVDENGKAVGFYLRQAPEKMRKLATIANKELRSKRVPKSTMKRSSGFTSGDEEKEVLQYSTIIGSVPPKPHMRRPYPTISSVHSKESAKTFIKAMMLLCREIESCIKEIAPTIYDEQVKLIEENVPEQWRFGKLFTSSISNYNIAADFHQDNANIQGCVNAIYTKRLNSEGGNTTVPDYDVTVDSCNDSLLIYPAWANLHGVTPIVPTAPQGYRNSLVFYPLKAFKNY